MRFLSSFFEPFVRPLARQIDRLHCTLDHLGHGLRERVLQAVGQAVAEAVRQAFRSLLVGHPTLTDDPIEPSRLRSTLWQHDERGRGTWYDDLDPPISGNVHHPEPFFDDDDAEPGDRPTTPASSCSRYTAWAAGLRVAAWALQRCGPYCIPVALGAGLLATLATYAGGPLIACSASFAAMLAGLLALDSGALTSDDGFADRAGW